MILEKNTTFLCVGDSITDANRRKPVGMGYYEELGNGYPNLLQSLLRVSYPELDIRVINSGISGNTTRDLTERWQEDVLDHKPDYVSILIGVNDVWRHFDSPANKENLVSIDEYTINLGKLVEKTLKQVKNVYLITPFFINPNTEDAMGAQVRAYADRVRGIAKKLGVTLIDMQKAFDEALTYNYCAKYSRDHVHPNLTGHTLIVRELLRALDYEF